MHKIPIFLCLLFSGFLFAEEPEILPLKTAHDWAQIDKNDAEWNEAQVFLLGEAHYVRENPAAQFELFRYLYENQEVRAIGLEFGRAEAWVYNRFLETGDTSLFKSTVIGSKVPEHRQYLDSLRHFNQSHPKAPVQFLGLDFERLLAMNVVFQSMEEQHDQLPEIFHIWSDSLQKMAAPGENRLNMKKIRLWMQEDWQEEAESLQQGLGKDYGLIHSIVFNPCFHENFSARDEKMALNYAEWQAGEGKGEKMFMPVGMFHIFRNRKKNLCTRLQDPTGPAKVKVLPLVSLYADCSSYSPAGMEPTKILNVYPRYHRKYFKEKVTRWPWKRALVNTSRVKDWNPKMPVRFLFIREQEVKSDNSSANFDR